MLRPRIRESVAVLRTAVASAGLQPSELHGILLVGGSSRIPLVRVMLSSEFDVPVTADVDPEMAVAFGAARRAAAIPAPVLPPLPPPAPLTPPRPTAPSPPTAPRPTAPAPRRRNPIMIAAVGIVAATVLIVAAVLLTSGDDDPSGGATTSTPTDTATNDTEVAEGDDCQRVTALGLANGIRRPDRPAFAEEGCDLVGVNLAGEDLGNVDLSFADFTGADLSGANLASSTCIGCDFTDVDLSNADLGGADLSGADLATADLASTRVEGALVNAETKLGPADGQLVFVNSAGINGLAGSVSTNAAQRSLGFVIGEAGGNGTEGDLATTVVGCRGDRATSDTRKVALYVAFLGGVAADEVDFSTVADRVEVEIDPLVSCVVLLGRDFALPG